MSDNARQEFVAHVRKSDGSEQLLYDHLTGTADIAKTLAIYQFLEQVNQLQQKKELEFLTMKCHTSLV